MAAKQVMDIQKVTSIDGGVSDEILRGWNDKKYESKEQNPTLNYDRSREHLNFEVGKTGEDYSNRQDHFNRRFGGDRDSQQSIRNYP